MQNREIFERYHFREISYRTELVIECEINHFVVITMLVDGLQPYLSSYTRFHLIQKQHVNTEAIFKYYISETITARKVILKG